MVINKAFFKNSLCLICLYLNTFPLSFGGLFVGGVSRIYSCVEVVNLPWIILDTAQSQTERHVPTQLLRRRHESLKIVLQTVKQSVDSYVTH